jgi:hypothetical protein
MRQQIPPKTEEICLCFWKEKVAGSSNISRNMLLSSLGIIFSD